MISQELYDKMMRLAKLNRFTSFDAKELQALIRETFNPSFVVCTHCPQQLKHAQKMVINFLNTVQVEGQELPQEILFESTPELDVDITEAEKVGCSKCKRKKTTKK